MGTFSRLLRVTSPRIRATAYVTRAIHDGHDLLVFDYVTRPDLGVHLPGGGIDPGERPDDAAVRETVEETGVDAALTVLGVVGVQQGRYDNGFPHVSVYFHLHSDDHRDEWIHTVIGGDRAWDTGLPVRSRFLPLAAAADALRASGHHQHQYVDLLRLGRIRRE